MERKIFIRSLIFSVAAPSLLIYACTGSQSDQTSVVQTYTCPMHPQVMQESQGKCPVCGMDLVPFDRTNKEQFLTLNENQRLLANITTVVIGEGSLDSSSYLNGHLIVNPDQTNFVSSRLSGRVETLYVKETGIQVKKGQPLYKLYSEQLLSLQQDYLLMEAQAEKLSGDKRFRELAHASRQKLLLYGQTAAQVDRLKQKGTVQPYVTYLAPSSGSVSELMVVEGQYVDEGSVLMRLEDYSQLWVEADVYPNEVSLIKIGSKLKVIVAGWENEPLDMLVQFIAPALASGGQVLQLRGTIENRNDWQPGLQVKVLLPNDSDSKELILPVDAVIRDGKTEHVWLETKQNVFEPKKVLTGRGSADKVEIRQGVVKGDKVVVTGAYLLYSEYVLKKGEHPLSV
jgi:Cu(I)/Ag(I) efflux system membrane fusion protein